LAWCHVIAADVCMVSQIAIIVYYYAAIQTSLSYQCPMPSRMCCWLNISILLPLAIVFFWYSLVYNGK